MRVRLAVSVAVATFSPLTFARVVTAQEQSAETPGDSVAALIASLDADEFARREAAMLALVRTGMPAMTPLERQIGKGNAEVDFRAIQILGQLVYCDDFQTGERAGAMLAELAESRDAAVRRWAEQALRRGSPKRLEMVTQKIESLGGECVVLGPSRRQSASVLSTDQIRVVTLSGQWTGGDRGLVHLRPLRALTMLQISDARVTDAGLAYVRYLPSLETLRLHNLPVTDKGLENLKNLKNLKELVISGAKIQGPGLAFLAELPRLEVLSLEGTSVGDDHVRHLAKIKSLRGLDLESLAVGDGAVAQLSGLERLRWLGLAHTKVTDEGLVFLRTHRSLRRLYLKETAVTDAGVRRLSKALPQLTVMR